MRVWQDASSAHVRGHVSVGKARRMTGFLVLSLYAGVGVLQDQFWNWWGQRCRPNFSGGLHVILHHYVPQFGVGCLCASALGLCAGKAAWEVEHQSPLTWEHSAAGDTWQALPLHGGVSKSLLGFPTPGVSQGVGGHTPLCDDLLSQPTPCFC